MALQYNIIAYEVNNLSDARYFAGMGVDMISFPLENSLDIQTFEGIKEWIEGVKIIGAFHTLSVERINEITNYLNLDYIHLYSKDYDYNQFNVPVIQHLTFDFHVDEIAPALNNDASFYILECNKADKDIYEDIYDLKNLYFKDKLIIGYGITLESIHKIYQYLNPYGFGLKGGNEIRPGYKDFDEMADILEAIEVD